MAVAPLFIASTAELKSLLRLSGAASSDVLKILDAAIKRARLQFYQRLTAPRITYILSFNTTDAPTTDGEYLREMANQQETLLVRYQLLITLPLRFLDGSGDSQQVWNDEAPFRDTSPDDREKELSRMDDEIEANFTFLEGSSDVPAGATIHGFMLEPDEPTRVGTSLGLMSNNGLPVNSDQLSEM